MDKWEIHDVSGFLKFHRAKVSCQWKQNIKMTNSNISQHNISQFWIHNRFTY